jgi:hypothetical protein
VSSVFLSAQAPGPRAHSNILGVSQASSPSDLVVLKFARSECGEDDRINAYVST